MENYSDIGSLQIRVLRVLWQQGHGTVHEVLEAFPPAERPAYTTILHVLRTLERRGFVAHRKELRQHRYYPLVEADEVETGVVHSLLSRIFSGSAERLVARLLEATPLEQRELDGIRQLIEGHERDTATNPEGVP